MKNRNRNRQALLFLWLLTLISCLIIFREFLFGDEFMVFNDVGSDTMQQYLMHYHSIAHALKEGNLTLWDFTNGFGTSMYALNLFHPLLFLIYLIGAATSLSVIPCLFVYLEIIQIFLAGTVFFYFLKEFPVSLKSRVIAAYIYGLNGYLLVWGQHYQFGLYTILLPLLLLLMEKSIKKKKYSFLLTGTVALSVLSSVYMSYMSFLALGIYLILRLAILNENRRERIRLFFIQCASILLGIGMMMIVFLPSAAYTLNISSRLNNGESMIDRLLQNLEPFCLHFYETAFYRLFSSNLNGIFDNFDGYLNYYEAPVLFLGVLFVILFFQYLFTIHKQETAKKIKIVQYIAIFLSFFFVLTPIGSMIFNAFAYAFSRHTFVFMPFAALMIAFMLDQVIIKKQLSFFGLAVSASLFLILYIKNPGTRQCNTFIPVALGFLMMGVFIVRWQRIFPLNAGLISIALLVLIMTNMCYDGYYSYNWRVTLKKSDNTYFTEMYGEDITQALKYLKASDSSFYRTEKDYYAGSFCMDSLGQNYYGISSYNSTINKNLGAFLQNFWPSLQRLSPYMYTYQQDVYATDMASLMNVKYLLSYNPSLEADGFRFKKQFGEIYLYENQNTNSIGKFYERTIQESSLPAMTSDVDIGSFLTDYLVVSEKGNSMIPDLSDYSMETIDYKLKKRTFHDKEAVVIPIKQKKLRSYDRVYLEFTLKLTEYNVVTIQFDESSCHYSAGNAEEPVTIRLRVPKNCEKMTISTTTPQNISGSVSNAVFYGSNNPLKASDKAKVTFDMPKKDTQITGKIQASTDGTLMMTIPYEDGWHAYVDGAETEILRADYGFQAIPISSGDHEITFCYEAVGLKSGKIISLICTLIYFILMFYRHRKQKLD